MRRNPSPPLLYRRKERYSSGNTKSQFAVSASIAASVAGACLVHPAVESLRISRSVAIGILWHNESGKLRPAPLDDMPRMHVMAGRQLHRRGSALIFTMSPFRFRDKRQPLIA